MRPIVSGGPPDALDHAGLVIPVAVRLRDDRPDHAFPHDLIFRQAEKFLRILIEESDRPRRISPQDDAVRIFHKFTVLLLAGFEFLERERVDDAQRDLRRDAGQEIDVTLSEGLSGREVALGNQPEKSSLVDEGHDRDRRHACFSYDFPSSPGKLFLVFFRLMEQHRLVLFQSGDKEIRFFHRVQSHSGIPPGPFLAVVEAVASGIAESSLVSVQKEDHAAIEI